VGLDGRIPAKANVDFVGEYHPRSFLDAEYTEGLRPQDLVK
jgi:hypothetical protein